MPRPFEERVVAITGASSGIGRATALAFAGRKANLVLIARESGGLETVSEECRSRGAKVLACSTDLTDQSALESTFEQILAAYGRLDVWASCAAVLSFGRFEDIPADAFWRVIETNLRGCVNGSRAALAQFQAQGGRGVLINMSSLLGVIGEPNVSPYVATKFAIRGFTACLRQEFHGHSGIRICLVMPTAVDTPIYSKAANFFGRDARSIYPVIAPERVARTIVSLAERPRSEVVVGVSGQLLYLAAVLAPRLTERLVARVGPRLQFKPEPQAPHPGNLFASAGPYEIHGGWRKYWAAKLWLNKVADQSGER